MMPKLTAINRYRLKSGAAAFSDAVSALAKRVEAEGERGVLSYRFYVHRDGLVAQAVIDYATPQAWIGHHDIAMEWPEMRALHAVAELAEVTFLGEVTPAIDAWIESSALRVRPLGGFGIAAGFRRG